MKLYSAVNAWEQCDATMEEVYYFLRDFLEEGNEIRTLVAWLPNIIEIDVYKDCITVFFKDEEGINLTVGIEKKLRQWIENKK